VTAARRFCAVGLDTPTRTYSDEKEPTRREKQAPPTDITCRVIASLREKPKRQKVKKSKWGKKRRRGIPTSVGTEPGTDNLVLGVRGPLRYTGALPV